MTFEKGVGQRLQLGIDILFSLIIIAENDSCLRIFNHKISYTILVNGILIENDSIYAFGKDLTIVLEKNYQVKKCCHW